MKVLSEVSLVIYAALKDHKSAFPLSRIPRDADVSPHLVGAFDARRDLATVRLITDRTNIISPELANGAVTDGRRPRCRN